MLDKITHFFLKGFNEREEAAAACTLKQRCDDAKEECLNERQ